MKKKESKEHKPKKTNKLLENGLIVEEVAKDLPHLHKKNGGGTPI